jgi:hypothetical protein
MAYAERTDVPVEKSQLEIRRLLEKYKATGFVFGEQAGIGVVMFEMQLRRVRFNLPMALYEITKVRGKTFLMSKVQVEQENRRLWRCLLLAIKAKMESVESGITTFEEEFLAHIVLPGGQTMGQVAAPQIAQSYKDGKMPPLLGYQH